MINVQFGWVSILLSALIHYKKFFHWPRRSIEDSIFKPFVAFLGDIIIPTILLKSISPKESIFYILRPLSMIFRQWPKLLSPEVNERFLGFGPFGVGYSKIGEVILVWYLLTDNDVDCGERENIIETRENRFDPFRLGSLPDMYCVILITIISMIFVVAIFLWSIIKQTRGENVGVNLMVRKFSERDLNLSDKIEILLLSIANASCEEVLTRGFLLSEFLSSGTPFFIGNVLQASAFGLWHLHGMPNGKFGVWSMFIFGILMGILRLKCNGLVAPIITHSIIDCFLFSFVARKKCIFTTCSDKTL